MNNTQEILQRLERIESALARGVMDKWLTFNEACRYAKASANTMRRWVHNGLVYGSKTTGEWRIDRESIDDFFNQERP